MLSDDASSTSEDQTSAASRDDVVPLFVQLQCTVRVNGRMISRVVHSLPGCVRALLNDDMVDGLCMRKGMRITY
jgi:hypothetical protein